MASLTATRRLLDLLLDGHLESFIQERRDQQVPWRLIAREVYERTGVDITAETLRSWFGQDRSAA
jgi:hypothetical protein